MVTPRKQKPLYIQGGRELTPRRGLHNIARIGEGKGYRLERLLLGILRKATIRCPWYLQTLKVADKPLCHPSARVTYLPESAAAGEIWLLLFFLIPPNCA